MKSNNDLIAQALEINPLVVPDRRVEPIVIHERDKMITRLDEDAEFARDNTKNLIKQGSEALDLLKQIAESTEHPRAFEVLSTLINTLAGLNKDLIGIHKNVRDIEGITQVDAPETVNNNLFVGTTEDALRMLKERRDKNGNN